MSGEELDHRIPAHPMGGVTRVGCTRRLAGSAAMSNARGGALRTSWISVQVVALCTSLYVALHVFFAVIASPSRSGAASPA